MAVINTGMMPKAIGGSMRLTAADRRGLAPSQFAVPSKGPGPGSYPLPDARHARAALSLVSQHGSPATQAKVRSAVRKDFPGIKVAHHNCGGSAHHDGGRIAYPVGR